MLAAILAAAIVVYEVFAALNTAAEVKLLSDTTKSALETVKSGDLADEEKAQRMQRGALRMFRGMVLLWAKLAAACAAGFAVLFAVSLAGWPLETLIDYSLRPTPLAVTVVFLLLYGLSRRALRQKVKARATEPR
jgi:hypothetical protein